MTAVVLGAADLALFADLSRSVAIPTLVELQPDIKYEGTIVRFVGDRFPTAFRGEGRAHTHSLVARFTRDQQAQLVELLQLFDDAADLPDSRLFLRTHVGQVSGLDAAQAVVVFAVQPVPQFGQYYDVRFSCEAVEFTLAV